MAQKYLSLIPAFPENSADVRPAQYELGDRTPKADLTAQMAEALDVSPRAIAVPDIDHMDGLMHTRLRAKRQIPCRRDHEGGIRPLAVPLSGIRR